jgi:hypothetical protein
MFNKLGSRKFQVLLISIGLFLYDSKDFHGGYLTVIFGLYLGLNVAQKVFLKNG